MNVNEFTKNAIKTESRIKDVNLNYGLFEGLMKTIIALGNNVDMIKKNVYYGKPINYEKWFENIDKCHDELQKSYNWSQYAIETPVPITNVNPRLFHVAIGIYTESIEMFEALFKTAVSENRLDLVNFMEEIGDTEWYQAIAYDESEIDPETVMETIISKLRKRYPDKFDATAAINRDLESERKILDTMIENKN